MSWREFLFPYRTHLEAELKQQRADHIERLGEKDTTIRSLRVELAAAKADIERLRNAPQKPVSNLEHIEPPSGWDAELSKLLQEEEDGIRNSGRIQEHEPRTDDGA